MSLLEGIITASHIENCLQKYRSPIWPQGFLPNY